jgi:hypothetical protein
VSALLRRVPGLSYEDRLAWDAFDRPAYAYGLYHAALEARALGIPRLSAIELGVAGGDGLLALERIAVEVGRLFDVTIDVYGFDSGGGMPPPVDHRDLPYVWQQGFFTMDEARLRGRLDRAELVIGPIAETVPRFIEGRRPAPVGFVSFDLDYYSSTASALQLFDAAASNYLPRVFCYFDDIVCDEGTYMSRYAGELLTIEEFNQRHANKKLAAIVGLSAMRRVPASWHEEMYVLHDFEHPLYAKYAYGAVDRQMPLR